MTSHHVAATILVLATPVGASGARGVAAATSPSPFITLIPVVVSVAGLLLSLVALFISKREGYRNRINNNTWQTYSLYNGPDIKHGRHVARALLGDQMWSQVRDYAGYRAFFRLDTPDGEEEERKRDEQCLHDLLALYHQLGLLLERNLLDREFTMLLVGSGLDDRWPALGKIPRYYEGEAYVGMYRLHDAYLAWRRRDFARLARPRGREGWDGEPARPQSHDDSVAAGSPIIPTPLRKT